MMMIVMITASAALRKLLINDSINIILIILYFCMKVKFYFQTTSISSPVSNFFKLSGVYLKF